METVTIVTTKANHLMVQVNNVKKRMPTILDEDLDWEWIMEIASTQYPSEMMDACTVAKDFLASLDPAAPFIYEDLPALELSIHG